MIRPDRSDRLSFCGSPSGLLATREQRGGVLSLYEAQMSALAILSQPI
jgi:hypothetical protein